MRQPYPILEYEPEPHGIIEIDLIEDAMEGMPEHCVRAQKWGMRPVASC